MIDGSVLVNGMRGVEMKRFIVMGIVVGSLLLAALVSGGGSIVILKNGQKLRCKEPMSIKGKNAIITLVTGVVTSYPLSQVDLIATERYNQLGLGNALTLDLLESEGKVTPTPTPMPSLGTLARISADNFAPDLGMQETEPTPTPGIKLNVSSYRNAKVDTAIREIFDRENLFLYRTSTGTKPEYFFVQTTTDSEKEVFTAIRIVAKAYTIILQRAPDLAPKALELQMVETSGRNAGTFRMTPEHAQAIKEGTIGVEKYYVENVIF